MMAVPAYVTCSELLRFISPAADKIIESKIIRDSSPNQYFVVIKFKSAVCFVPSFHFKFMGFRPVHSVSIRNTMVSNSIRWRMITAHFFLWSEWKR
jgi:BRCA1-associated protein